MEHLKLRDRTTNQVLMEVDREGRETISDLLKERRESSLAQRERGAQLTEKDAAAPATPAENAKNGKADDQDERKDVTPSE